MEDTGSGEPILFIHGFPLSGEMWSETVRRLPSEYRPLVPDLRGHGRSPAEPGSSMSTHAADLIGLLDSRGIDRPVVLVGLSMGGYVAFEVLRRAPSSVRALVLANTRASADTLEQAETRRATAARVLREGVGFLAEDMASKLLSPIAPEELRQRWRDIMARTPPQGAADALLAMAERPDSLETLRSFDGPSLIIAGADDRIIPVEEAKAMADAAKRSRFEVVKEAGHLTPVEQPERFVSLLVEFLASLPR